MINLLWNLVATFFLVNLPMVNNYILANAELRITKFTDGVNEKQRGMVLPFQPLTMCFSNMNYYVDVPLVHITTEANLH